MRTDPLRQARAPGKAQQASRSRRAKGYVSEFAANCITIHQIQKLSGYNKPLILKSLSHASAGYCAFARFTTTSQ